MINLLTLDIHQTKWIHQIQFRQNQVYLTYQIWLLSIISKNGAQNKFNESYVKLFHKTKYDIDHSQNTIDNPVKEEEHEDINNLQEPRLNELDLYSNPTNVYQDKVLSLKVVI